MALQAGLFSVAWEPARIGRLRLSPTEFLADLQLPALTVAQMFAEGLFAL
jgi:hypothetical protein